MGGPYLKKKKKKKNNQITYYLFTLYWMLNKLKSWINDTINPEFLE